MNPIIYINNRPVPLEGETNILAVARKAHIDIPTFCYHSELSVYGACRLCLVEVEGRGLVTSCSTPPMPGMRVHTHTKQILDVRRTIVEMLLANHDQQCPTCARSETCKLRELSAKLGINEVRYRKTREPKPLDTGSRCLVRDPNKCVLCGDCVRFCNEIQGIGAIDFAHRGEEVTVAAAFNKSLSDVDCVNCGQCAAVCPVGAITIRSETEQVWEALHDPEQKVVAQIAPAVRVAIGEMFGLPTGEVTTGRIVAAMRLLGFDRVYDTSFAADLTVIEEGTELLNRKTKSGKLPVFTSCCPAWVKYAEQSWPELLPYLSSCRSPQQMFGSLARRTMPAELNVSQERLTVVSIMPCTAKKYECARPEFTTDGMPDVDYALTTQELGRMIQEAGIDFAALEPEAMDMPMGMATGAGVLFGKTGGVSEAVLRYAAEKLGEQAPEAVDLTDVRGLDGLREAEVTLGGVKLRLAVVHGLKNAALIAQKVLAGEADYDVVEVMACPGGCIGGAGQPIVHSPGKRAQRATAIANADRTTPLRKPQQNPFVQALYGTTLDEPNGHAAHELLHTHYTSRRRIADESIALSEGAGAERIPVRVCVGTSCYLRGAHTLLAQVLKTLEDNDWQRRFDLGATFCSEQCDRGPTVTVGDTVLHHADIDKVTTLLKDAMK